MKIFVSSSRRNGFLAIFFSFWFLSLLAEHFLLPKRFLLTDLYPLAEETYSVVAVHPKDSATPTRKTLSPEDSEILQKELLRLRLRVAQSGESGIIPGPSDYLEFWGEHHVIRIIPFPSNKGAHIEIKKVTGIGENGTYLEGDYLTLRMRKISQEWIAAQFPDSEISIR